MDHTHFKILAIDTSASEPRLALMDCPQGLSVERSDILDHLVNSEKRERSPEPDSCDGGNPHMLANLFKRISISEPIQANSSVYPSSSSQSLIPQIRMLLRSGSDSMDAIDLIVVALGPGSFTGLRIGVTVGKTIGYAAGCNIVGINLMEAAATQADWFQHPSPQPSIAVAANAGRGDILAAVYDRMPQGVQPSVEPRISKPDEWLQTLTKQVILTGDGVSLLNPIAINAVNATVVDEPMRRPTLETMALMGLRKFLSTGPDDPWILQPVYSRPSAAEEARGIS